MPKYQTKFDLNLDDMTLIETALQNAATSDAVDSRQAHDLLGRLHNQKIFYRPRDGVYVSG